jgi:hypothetical protein
MQINRVGYFLIALFGGLGLAMCAVPALAGANAETSLIIASTGFIFVLTAAGLGLKYIAWNATDKDIIGPLGAFGVLGIAIGVGLMVSALAALVMSKRLGVWQPPAALADTDARVTD